MAPDPSSTAGAAAGASSAPVSPLEGILHSPLPVMVIIFGLFWWLFIRPQQRQQKERESQLKQLKEGDKVIMVSGVHATVTKVEEETLGLRIADNVTVKAQRTAVDRKVQA